VADEGTGGEVANALVCKTSIHGFKSHPVLQKSISYAEIRKLLQPIIDSMPHGGTLRLAAIATVNGLNIEISDTGPGIPAEVQTKILEPFFTTKGRNGTGLGLTISAEIIARHGGTLNFDTTTDHRRSGTCFKFFLPFQQTETEITRTTRKT
jgi:K+-sensing histidine kinase KdpD